MRRACGTRRLEERTSEATVPCRQVIPRRGRWRCRRPRCGSRRRSVWRRLQRWRGPGLVRHTARHHAWRKKHQQFRAPVFVGSIAEQGPQQRHVAQPWHAGATVPALLLIDAADRDGSPVLDLHLGLDVPGIHGKSLGNLLAHTILAHVDIQNYLTVRRNQGRDLQTQRRFAELDRRGASPAAAGLIGQFRALLDDRLNLVGSHDSRA